MEIGVVGTGYVGLVTGACLADLGHRVTCVDSDRTKVEALRRGETPIFEPDLPALLASGRDSGALTFTDRLEEGASRAQVIFICVGTPPRSNGDVDLSQVEAAAREIGTTLGDGYRVIVNKSTVPVGSGDWVRKLLEDGLRARRPAAALALAGGGRDDREGETREPGNQGTRERGNEGTTPGPVVRSFSPSLLHSAPSPYPVSFDVVSNPEFLREGSAIRDMLHPDRIIIGSTSPRAVPVMRELYAPILEQQYVAEASRRPVPFITTDLASAEMIKYAANAFLATKISFINEIANICERVGARVDDVAHGIGLDARIGRRFLDAGVGWGGSCFGKDVSALTQMALDYGYEAPILHAVRAVNEHQRQWVVKKLQERLKVLKGKTVGLLGLAFKPHTDDVRDAPALAIAERLLELGVTVRGLDPVAGPRAAQVCPRLTIARDASELADGADALVLVTEWFAFRTLDYEAVRSRMRQPVLIDGRNALDGEQLRELGFEYWGVGQ